MLLFFIGAYSSFKKLSTVSTMSCSLPTLDSIPQSALHQRKTASKYFSFDSSPAHVPRPRNAYLLYRSWALSYHPSLTGLRASTKQDMLSRMAGWLWNAESEEVRNHFMSLAAEEKKRHADRALHPHRNIRFTVRYGTAPVP